MKTFIWISTVVICSISWISVSEAQPQTVKVQPGQNVTLLSPKRSKNTVMTWSKLINTTKAICICTMTCEGEAHFCDGFNNGKFQMGVNTNNTVFLTIKNVDLSDSGIYFCQYLKAKTITYYLIQLNVKGSEETQDDLGTECLKWYETTYVMSLSFGGLTVFLLMVVTGLVVSVRKRQAASGKRQDPQQHERVDCDDLKAAALSVYSPAVRSRRPASQRQVETHVTYAATDRLTEQLLLSSD